jgi:hypothetical protein
MALDDIINAVRNGLQSSPFAGMLSGGNPPEPDLTAPRPINTGGVLRPMPARNIAPVDPNTQKYSMAPARGEADFNRGARNMANGIQSMFPAGNNPYETDPSKIAQASGPMTGSMLEAPLNYGAALLRAGAGAVGNFMGRFANDPGFGVTPPNTISAHTPSMGAPLPQAAPATLPAPVDQSYTPPVAAPVVRGGFRPPVAAAPAPAAPPPSSGYVEVLGDNGQVTQHTDLPAYQNSVYTQGARMMGDSGGGTGQITPDMIAAAHARAENTYGMAEAQAARRYAAGLERAYNAQQTGILNQATVQQTGANVGRLNAETNQINWHMSPEGIAAARESEALKQGYETNRALGVAGLREEAMNNRTNEIADKETRLAQVEDAKTFAAKNGVDFNTALAAVQNNWQPVKSTMMPNFLGGHSKGFQTPEGDYVATADAPAQLRGAQRTGALRTGAGAAPAGAQRAGTRVVPKNQTAQYKGHTITSDGQGHWFDEQGKEVTE